MENWEGGVAEEEPKRRRKKTTFMLYLSEANLILKVKERLDKIKP